MHRQQLLSALVHYAKRWPTEKKVVERFVCFIENHENCFSRNCLPGHITGSAWLLNAKRTHLLLTHHKKLNRWLQLGGHSDDDPNSLNVALREAEEESGLKVVPLSREILDIDIHEIPQRKSEAAHLHYDVRFALVSFQGDDFSISDESHDLAWVQLDALASYTQEESILRMREKWIEHERVEPHKERGK